VSSGNKSIAKTWQKHCKSIAKALQKHCKSIAKCGNGQKLAKGYSLDHNVHVIILRYIGLQPIKTRAELPTYVTYVEIR